MRNIFVLVVLVIASIFSDVLMAQSLDPTVEVTREYEGKLMEIHKPSLKMSVPDSVMHFALDFDYSVFENPYKGSYDFNPYLLSMRPSSSDSGENRFFLRAGAGYQLYPELDVIWSPKFKKNTFNMDVYALHRSFIGKYWEVIPDNIGGDEYKMIRKPSGADSRTWSGYDLMSNAGIDCRYDASSVAVDFGARYFSLAQQDKQWKRCFNALDARLGITTKPEHTDAVVYDIDVLYRYGHDRMASDSRLSEHLFDFDMTFGPVLRGNHRLKFDLGVNMASYSEYFSTTVGEVMLTPHYVFAKGPFNLDLGIKFAKMLRSKEMNGMFGSKEQIVYPDVTIFCRLLPKALRLYIRADGGNRINTYSSIIERNHHLTYTSSPAVLDTDLERISACIGFDGRISSKFSYNIRGGYVNSGNSLLDAVVSDGRHTYASLMYAPYEKWYVKMDWCLKTEDIRFDGEVSYDHAWGDVFDQSYVDMAVLKPSAFSGDVSFEYNWRKRVFGGIDCSFATYREGNWGESHTRTGDSSIRTMSVPGYVDLGVYCEYATSRDISFWLRAGNLLNMTIQRNPLYAEKGVNFTAGICLKF